MSEDTVKYLLPESEIPTHWINLLPDLPGEPLPPLHPATLQPAGPDDLTPIFPMALIGQEVSPEPKIEIPEPVREAYKIWRPTPLFRARRLERELDTPARIYYKYEGVSPAGSHKPNTAVAQAYENAQAGIKRLCTETGAGQWGSALAFACALFGLECEVFMVGSSYDQKPYRRSMMQTWGATVHRSPSDLTEAGRANAEHATGSLGIAISEAVEVAAQREDTNYSLGSVLNHVCLHQTVIGQEAAAQMAMAGDQPDVVIGCVSSGSTSPVFASRSSAMSCAATRRARFFAAEPAACPTLTKASTATTSATPRAHAADADIHARTRLHAPAGSCGRVVTTAMRRCCTGSYGRGSSMSGVRPDETFAGGGAVRPLRGHHSRARAGAAIRAVEIEAEAAKQAGEGEGDPVQALRPRSLRPSRVRRFPGRQARVIQRSPRRTWRRRWLA